MNFTERLRGIQGERNSLVCIGLDTDSGKLPASLGTGGDRVYEFNRRIIDATHDLVCAYKINLAFYEVTGERGWRTVRQTLSAIPNDVVSIGDAKRGDIGNSSAMYAKALAQGYGFTASTVNPYMGFDSVEPFLADPGRGAFILAVTSNPGAKDFQYLKTAGRPLYERVIRKARSWNMNGNIGLVVGATRPKEMQSIRRMVPDMPILIPGIGAQGGDLKAAVRCGCDRYGTLAVINASRSVIFASSGDDFGEAARTAALTLRNEINRYREMYY